MEETIKAAVEEKDAFVGQEADLPVVEDNDIDVVKDEVVIKETDTDVAEETDAVIVEKSDVTFDGDADVAAVQQVPADVVKELPNAMVEENDEALMEDENTAVVEDTNAAVVGDENAAVVGDENTAVVEDENAAVVNEIDTGVVESNKEVTPVEIAPAKETTATLVVEKAGVNEAQADTIKASTADTGDLKSVTDVTLNEDITAEAKTAAYHSPKIQSIITEANSSVEEKDAVSKEEPKKTYLEFTSSLVHNGEPVVLVLDALAILQTLNEHGRARIHIKEFDVKEQTQEEDKVSGI